MEEVIEAVDSPSSTPLSPYEESFAQSSASIAGIAVVVCVVVPAVEKAGIVSEVFGSDILLLGALKTRSDMIGKMRCATF